MVNLMMVGSLGVTFRHGFLARLPQRVAVTVKVAWATVRNGGGCASSQQGTVVLEVPRSHALPSGCLLLGIWRFGIRATGATS